MPEIPAPLPDTDDTTPSAAAPEPEPGGKPSTDRGEAQRWLLGGAISLAAHVGIGLYLAAITLPPAAGPDIVDAISVEWVPPDVSEAAPKAEGPAEAAEQPAASTPQPDAEKAPEKPSQDEPTQAQPAPEQDKSPATEAAPQPQEETPETRTAAQPKEETTPAAELLRSVQEDMPAEPSLPVIAKAPESKLARPIEKPDTARRETRQAESKGRSRKATQAEPAEPVRPERKSVRKKTVTAKPSGASEKAVRPAAASSKQAASTRPVKATGGSGVSPAKWQAQVNAHIRRFKQYPDGASGSASVRIQFRINALGAVKSAAVAGSSGNAALDRAAVETVKRASPVPAPPAEIVHASMTLAITINFKR